MHSAWPSAGSVGEHVAPRRLPLLPWVSCSAEGEVVEAVVAGQLYGANALGALTNQRFVVVNDREFKPDVIALTVDAGCVVQGWQDDRNAALLVQSGGQSAQIERIADRPMAVEMAHRLPREGGRPGLKSPSARKPLHSRGFLER